MHIRRYFEHVIALEMEAKNIRRNEKGQYHGRKGVRKEQAADKVRAHYDADQAPRVSLEYLRK